jgi:phosphoribosylformylglycinamidine cyclo-ligase
MTSPGATYRKAGVDIDAGNQLVERIGPLAARTTRPEVLAGIGGFGALVRVPLERFREPVLVSGTDGVGTKVRLALEEGGEETIGIDLVAMCVNDVLVHGAEPLFFLDYYASGRLDVERATRVIAGIAEGCRRAGCALVGGETAEMPGLYTGNDFDLAGFAVGVVERERILDGRGVRAGHRVLALSSSGPHANGYSLIRRILDTHPGALDAELDGVPLRRLLLAPTRIYVDRILPLLEDEDTRPDAMCHVTGGGIVENLPRVLPRGLGADLARGSWPVPPVFAWIAEHGPVAVEEMDRVFNGGVGFLLVVDPRRVENVRKRLASLGEEIHDIGGIVSRPGVRIG